MDADYLLARQLQKEFDVECSQTVKDETDLPIPCFDRRNVKSLNSTKDMSLVDPQWELIDPTPDIHSLFSVFNERFFWGKLHAVEVRWSPRMTSCAGVCVYQSRAGFCSVRLSRPLLILRPRKDLVETLLHEMIHAYLFVTHNNRDRDGHGPEFHRHMDRINKGAGTHISVYHTFHAEVRNYQQHMWRCNGPCQKRAPFFGIVRRAMNRAPGPNDLWWAQHETTCGGKFTKCQEPENFGNKKSKEVKSVKGVHDIRSFFPSSQTAVSSSKIVDQGTSHGTALGSGKPGEVSAQPPAFGNLSKANSIRTINGSGVGTSFQGTNSIVPPGSGKPLIVGFGDLRKGNIVHKPAGGEGASKTMFGSNIVGFKDLENSGKKNSSSGGHFGSGTGKGYVLGNGQTSLKKPIYSSDKPYMDIGGVGGRGMLSSRSSTNSPKRPIQSNTKVGVFGKMLSNTPTGLNKSVNSINKPQTKTGNGVGGMLSNRGSGTFVLTGKTKNVQDSDNLFNKNDLSNKSIPNTSEVFHGTGYVLGKGNKTETSTAISKSASPLSYENGGVENVKCKTTGTQNNSDPSINMKNHGVCCPVCNITVNEDINSHLDVCLHNCFDTKNHDEATFKSQGQMDVVTISDDEEDVKIPQIIVSCPICACSMGKSDINAHLNICLGNTFSETDDMMSNNDSLHDSKKSKCPICENEVLASDLDMHLESCASCSVQEVSGAFEEDFSDDEEDAAVGSPSKLVSDSGERLYPCPCCFTMIELSKMNDHLDVCVPYSAFGA